MRTSQADSLFHNSGARQTDCPAGHGWARRQPTVLALRPASAAPNADRRGNATADACVHGEATPATQVQIDVVSQSPTLLAAVAELLGDDRTAVGQHRTMDSLHSPNCPDLIVLDRSMLQSPCSDLRRVRRKSVTTEIVVLGAHDASDVIRLLDSGADDAITAGDTSFPSRLHAHARRARTRKIHGKTDFTDLRLDHETNRVWCAGEMVSLTSIEAALLRSLFAKAPAPVTSKALAEFVWGASDTRDRRAVIRVYIGYLREKLRRSEHATIRSVHGVGYQLSFR